MSVITKITMDAFPEADKALSYFKDAPKEFSPKSPTGSGWKLEYSFMGNNVIYHVWKKGQLSFDNGYQQCWVGVGDDITNGIVGGGQEFLIESTQGTPEKFIDVEFIPGDSFINGGRFMWEGVGNRDMITMQVYSKANSVIEDVAGNIIIIDGAIIPVGDGNGTHSMDGPPSLCPALDQNGHWNFDMDAGLPIEAPDGEGYYHMLIDETLVSRTVNKVMLYPHATGSTDVVGVNGITVIPGYYFRFIAHNNSDTNWTVSVMVHLYRKLSV